MSARGLVSRVTPVQTALRTAREMKLVLRVRQSGVDLKPPQVAVVKSDGGERCGKIATRSRQIWLERRAPGDDDWQQYGRVSGRVADAVSARRKRRCSARICQIHR